MALIGILYLLFEKTILASRGQSGQGSQSLDHVSKSIVGAQVGLILLAMLVTRSSIASLQAKHGLPFGNQVMGWIVLGMGRCLSFSSSSKTDPWHSRFASDPIPARSEPQQPLPSPSGHYFLDILPDIYHSHNLLRRSVLFRLLYDSCHMGEIGTPHLYMLSEAFYRPGLAQWQHLREKHLGRSIRHCQATSITD